MIFKDKIPCTHEIKCYDIRQSKVLSNKNINEKGSVLVVAMATLSGLLAIGGIAVLSSQRTLKISSHQRSNASALLAAESGVHAAMDYLSKNFDEDEKWGGLVFTKNQNPNGGGPLTPLILIPGNALASGESGNLFSDRSKQSYSVTVLNNIDDPRYSDPTAAEDGIVLIRSIGYGPNQSKVILEVEVGNGDLSELSSRPCDNYAQENQSADGSGVNNCIGDIDSTVQETITLGGS